MAKAIGSSPLGAPTENRLNERGRRIAPSLGLTAWGKSAGPPTRTAYATLFISIWRTTGDFRTLTTFTPGARRFGRMSAGAARSTCGQRVGGNRVTPDPTTDGIPPKAPFRVQ